MELRVSPFISVGSVWFLFSSFLVLISQVVSGYVGQMFQCPSSVKLGACGTTSSSVCERHLFCGKDWTWGCTMNHTFQLIKPSSQFYFLLYWRTVGTQKPKEPGWKRLGKKLADPITTSFLFSCHYHLEVEAVNWRNWGVKTKERGNKWVWSIEL